MDPLASLDKVSQSRAAGKMREAASGGILGSAIQTRGSGERPAGCLSVGSFAYALGSCKFDVYDSAVAGRLVSPAEDLAAAGFRWHHLHDPTLDGYDLARLATAQLADARALNGIDAIIYGTCLPAAGSVGDPAAWASTRDVKHLMDYPASRLQADFGLVGAAVIGLTQQGCTGMLGAIRLAAALLTTEPDWRRVLCVTADRLPDGALYEQSYNLVSDCAAACIVSRGDGPYRYLGAHQITNGGLGTADDGETIGMFFSHTHRLVTETLSRHGLDLDDLDWVVTQNTNLHAWPILGRTLGIERDRIWFGSLPDAAHAQSADNIINLIGLAAAGRISPGQRLALVMVGTGVNLQCVLLEAAS